MTQLSFVGLTINPQIQVLFTGGREQNHDAAPYGIIIDSTILGLSILSVSIFKQQIQVLTSIICTRQTTSTLVANTSSSSFR